MNFTKSQFVFVAAFVCGTAHGQIFIANNRDSTIGEYALSGATINPSLITGLNNPLTMTSSGNTLFVGNGANNTVGAYTTAGGTVSPALITGLHYPTGLVLSVNFIFLAQYRRIHDRGGDGKSLVDYWPESANRAGDFRKQSLCGE
jgi:hypothetical protein